MELTERKVKQQALMRGSEEEEADCLVEKLERVEMVDWPLSASTGSGGKGGNGGNGGAGGNGGSLMAMVVRAAQEVKGVMPRAAPRRRSDGDLPLESDLYRTVVMEVMEVMVVKGVEQALLMVMAVMAARRGRWLAIGGGGSNGGTPGNVLSFRGGLSQGGNGGNGGKGGNGGAGG